MNIQVASREEYFTQAGNREDDLRRIDAIIRESAPSLRPVLTDAMSGQMLGYGPQPYQTKSMKQPGTYPVVALAVQKNHLSLYICAVIDGRYVAEIYGSDLGKVSVGKSCIRFKTVDDLELEPLRAMLEELELRVRRGEHLFGDGVSS